MKIGKKNQSIYYLMLIAACLFVSTFSSSCARNISGQIDNILRIEIKITFETTPNISNYLYYIIFSTQQEPRINKTLPLDYFFTPGQLVDFRRINPPLVDTNVSTYYDSYFDTWSDYILFTTNNSADLFNSDRTQFHFLSNTENNSTYRKEDGFIADNITINGNTLNIQFTLQSLTKNVDIGDTIHFTIATSDKNSEQQLSGTLIDVMESNAPSIVVPTTRIEFLDSDQDATEHSAANITNVEARIF